MKRRVGIVGLGDIATKAYLPVLIARPDVELVVCSRTASKVEQAMARHDLQLGTTELDEFVGFGPQAAFVLTPSPMHFDVARQLLEAGIDVFVEKPATLRSEDTLALTEFAERHGRILMAGFNRRFAPIHRQARELWGSRSVGFALFQKHRSSAAHPDLLENYVDDTIHIIDLLRYFCGEAKAVSTEARVHQGKLVDALSVVALEGGGRGVIATSLEAGGWSETYSLNGEGTTVDIEAFSSIRTGGETEERIWRESYASGWKPTLEARGFTQQVAHFFDCLDSRREPLVSGRSAYLTQRLLEDLVACANVSES